ncbi:MAG: MFS transporter [Nocardioides sp.]|uniref:MFS transporter n=1 Tax=Nocardioides sp. TaxID=35761 RepID=UPI003F055227
MTVLLDAFLPPRLGGQFRRLVAGSWTTNLGDGLALAAGPLLVASQTRDPLLVAMAPLLQQLPWLLFGLQAGVLADRLDRRLLLVVANLSRCVVLAVLVGVLASGQVGIGGVLAAVFALGLAETFADTTSSTLTPMLVAKKDLGLANSRMMAGILTINQLVGPPLGAALFALGAVWPFAAQTVLLVVGTMVLSGLRLPAHGRQASGAGERPGVRAEIADGLRWLWRHAPVRTLTLVIVLFNVTWGAAWSVLVLYATQHLGSGEIGYGLLVTVGAVGGLVGTTLYPWLERRVPLGGLMKGCLVLEAVVHLAFALNRWTWLAMVIMLVFGCYAFVWGALSSAVRQRAVPTEYQGRVASVYLMGVFGGIVVGSALGGLIAREWGVVAPFWFAFVGSVVILAAMWRSLDLIVHHDEQTLAADEAQ